MTLADEIRALSLQALTALDASHDYYTYTKRVWRLIREGVREGRRFTFRNRATGGRADDQILFRRAQHYIKENLASSTFQQFVSLFESFLFGVLRCWLAAYPASLSRKQVEVGLVLKAADKNAVVLAVIDKELNELK